MEKEFRRRIMEYLDTVEVSAKRDIIHQGTEKLKSKIVNSIYKLCKELIKDELLNEKNIDTNIK